MRRWIGVFALLTLAATAAPAEARTTKLAAFSRLPFHPQGYFARGDGIRVIARNFIPPPLCNAKVRFTFEDSAGHKVTLGRYRPHFGSPQGVISRKVGEVPAAAAFGRGVVSSRQSCNVGTASGRDSVVVVNPSLPVAKVTAPTATGAESGNKARLRFTIDRKALVTVAIDFELVPGTWREVDVELENAFYKDPGTFSVDWRANVGGLVPPGSYRFRVTPRAPAAGLGQAVIVAFTIRPRQQVPRPGAEPAVVRGVATGAAATVAACASSTRSRCAASR